MIVVDATAVLDALALPEGGEAVAARLAHEELHAPAHLDDLVVAGAAGLVAVGALSSERAYQLLDDFDDLPIRRWPAARPLRERTLQLIPMAGAGAAWVALAQALGCPLVTRDVVLARACAHVASVDLL